MMRSQGTRCELYECRLYKQSRVRNHQSKVERTRRSCNRIYSKRTPCEIYAEPDGTTFTSDKLPIKPAYDYTVFDVIVDLLYRQAAAPKRKRQKLQARRSGLRGKYRGRNGSTSQRTKTGDSVFDPVFVLAAVLEWAGIAENGRGELILTKEYTEKL